MARRDSNDPLNAGTTGSRTTTLDTTETTGTSGAGLSGATGTGSTLGSSGVSGVSSGTATGVGATGAMGGYGTSGTGTAGTGSYGTTGTGSSQTNWQRAGEDQGSQGVKEQAKGLASEAKNEVRGMAGQAKSHVQNLVGERKDRAAEQVSNFAGSLRDAARKLEEGDGGATALGRYATTAADQVERVSQYLRDRDLQSFVRDAETFARRHPDVFLGGTFIAGLVLARFFKASDRRDETDFNETLPSYGTMNTGGYGSPSGGYGSSSGTSYGSSYGSSYGNTYNAGTSPVSGTAAGSATGSTSGSTYENERSENTWTPGGPVPPVGG
jgi:uncharacterized protein YjbJ (UPF0337 family)